MPKVVRSTILDAPIEAVWEVLRDFNGFDRWHPSIDASQMERGAPADKVGCVRKVRLADGSELREQLLGLSEAETMFTYCLLDTPVPLFNYVAHIRLIPVTDGDRTFWQWEGNFTARPEEQAAMIALVDEGIFQAGFAAIREYMGLAGQQG
jgi:hypothetical protein